MIRIQTRRAGIICLAATVNNLNIATAWSLTHKGAVRRLMRRLDR